MPFRHDDIRQIVPFQGYQALNYDKLAAPLIPPTS
jgi:hypothetical protein